MRIITRDRALVSVAYIFVALIGSCALGADPTASFPLGDGGLFYAVIEQIRQEGFAYPTFIAYNALHIPFAYSPGAFYAVASLGTLAHLQTSFAMNVWVCIWGLAIGPAILWTARRFFCSQPAAFAAAVYAVLVPHSFIWLGTGGGVTRTPGFVFFVLSCGAIRRLAKGKSLRDVPLAAVLSAACAWVHMEFFLLLVVSSIIISLHARMKLAHITLISSVVIVLVAPWPMLLLARGIIGAAAEAMHTSQGGVGFTAANAFYSVFGAASESPLFVVGIIAVIGTLAQRDYVWAGWALVIALLDTRAGAQVQHLIIGLAVARCVVACETRFMNADLLGPLGFGLGIALLGIASIVSPETSSVVRLSQADERDMASLASIEPSGTSFIVASIGYEDQTYEWFPALAHRRSVTAFQGLEWVDAKRFRAVSREQQHVHADCPRVGPSCYRQFAGRVLGVKARWYLYLPSHSAYSDLLRQAITADRCLLPIRKTEAATLFRALDSATLNDVCFPSR